ncbi:MAG: DUF2130 domain-containing protein [Bacteroidales bacterium]|nr:DUF2130 domain-containing protein [Bacteroidales bacterium]
MKELKCPRCGSVFKVDEADYASILSQVRNAEFNGELERRASELEARMEAERKVLKAELQSVVEKNGSDMKIAVMKEQEKAREELRSKEARISELEAKARLDKAEAAMHENNIREEYENRLKVAQEQVEYYRDLKARMSTKMVGETLEVHCSTEYNTRLRSLLPNAYFEKDNDASSGSKGDFIFRDFEDGVEYVSIMFEMKNEMDTTAARHRNEDFLKELDKDRKEKGCEYAVLVSLLEPDSDLYNSGIVDKSYLYDRMYVIRPQFFVPLITLLVQTSKKSLEYRKELQIAKNQYVDITGFEDRLLEFKDKFSSHASFARERFNDAIKSIDASIKKLQDVRDNLVKSDNYIRLADGDVDGLTIKKLTWNNPTMKRKFDEARAAGSAPDVRDGAGEPDNQ